VSKSNTSKEDMLRLDGSARVVLFGVVVASEGAKMS
jgi:hypothetical protein